MRFFDFERVVSQKRMSRYVNACCGDTRKAQTLYRHNLRISQEMFTMISCFEVAIRNAIDNELTRVLGNLPLNFGLLVGCCLEYSHINSVQRRYYTSITPLFSMSWIKSTRCGIALLTMSRFVF